MCGSTGTTAARRMKVAPRGYDVDMTSTPAESSDRAQGDSDRTSTGDTDVGIDDSQLPEDLQPGPDNPLASPDEEFSDTDTAADDDSVPEGDAPPGEPSIG
jgi:hypothetical protein